jgi:hypothetical protein
MATLEDRLRARYGGDRFNPAKGQRQMSYQEWMDRHPSLRNMKKEDTEARYQQATSTDSGVNWDDFEADAPEMFTSGRATLDESGKLQTSSATYEPPARGNDLRDGLPARPDPVPGGRRGRLGRHRGKGPNVAAAKRRHGGSGISSNRTAMPSTPPGGPDKPPAGNKPPVMGANWLKKPGARDRIADMVRKGEVRLPTPPKRDAPFPVPGNKKKP